jgi:hypothetical protein
MGLDYKLLISTGWLPCNPPVKAGNYDDLLAIVPTTSKAVQLVIEIPHGRTVAWIWNTYSVEAFVVAAATGFTTALPLPIDALTCFSSTLHGISSAWLIKSANTIWLSTGFWKQECPSDE